MSDYSLPACVTLVFGRSGCGKTSFAFRYIANALTVQDSNHDPAACVFIFDWKLEASRRFGISPITSEHGFEAALASRLVVFNPNVMFPGDRPVTGPDGKEVLNDLYMGFRWFCKRVFEISTRGPGKKILYADELREYVSKYVVPPELSRVARAGRAEHLELLMSTQYPRDYHTDLRSAVTEWVCFSTDEPAELDAVRPYYANVDRVKGLAKGRFLAWNRDTRAELAGQVF
jgi:GTPase SAR1 family protein